MSTAHGVFIILAAAILGLSAGYFGPWVLLPMALILALGIAFGVYEACQ